MTDRTSGVDRRRFLRNAGLTAGAAGGAFAGLLGSPGDMLAMAQEMGRSETPLRAAFSNAGLQATWCAQGKSAAEAWGRLYNVDVTWFDGELSAPKQRSAIDTMATQDWDFVAIQAFGIGTLTDPVQRMIDKGIPVIAMDTLIAPLEQFDVHAFIAPDNEFMGASVTRAVVDAMGGEGGIVMTQGALGHSGAQGRARGFHSVIDGMTGIELLDEQPADWDVTKATRIWDSLLTKYGDQIKGAFFHNDDMALAAQNIMRARGRDDIIVGGVDAMPPAVEAVIDGRMHATVRNPSSRIHGGALVAGVAAKLTGETSGAGIPEHVVADGPVVTKANAAGMLWMQNHYLI